MTTKREAAATRVETEAKIHVSSFGEVKRRIVAAGGRLTSARKRETNTLFDTPKGALREAGRSFRVRRYGASGSVTLKGAARVSFGLKSRVELESEISDPETMTQILISLGLSPQFRYEKFREVWKVGPTSICLDETPIGRFVEIEGTDAAIHRVSAKLGLSPDRFLSASYPGLWMESGRSGDMLFPPTRQARAERLRPRKRSQAPASGPRPRAGR